MNIVYNCDDSYTPHTAVSILSLFEHNKAEQEIRVFILGNGISTRSVQRFAAMAAAYHSPGYPREIRVLDLQNFEEQMRIRIGEALDAGRFTVTALARIFAAEYLPEDVDRYLYLDCDTVVLKDLRELYTADLEGNICGMAAEPTIYPEVRSYLQMEGDTPYYNTGMMLVDRRAWEAEDRTGACVEFYRSRGGRLPFSDQDVLNACLKGRVKTLWQGWDFFSNYHYQSYGSLVQTSPWYGKIQTASDFDRARKDPAVVHFAGAERPWVHGNFNPYRKEYHKYLARTPWRDQPQITGQESSMLLYHLMNLMTRLCPPVRRWISSYYYRKHIQKKA